jgi:pyroglutamyl-peptidase
MKTLLLTGFEPFGRFRVNSSWEAIRELDGQTRNGWRIVCRRLSVRFRRAGPELRRFVRETRPRSVVCFGLAASRTLRLERVALNVDHAPGGDNDRLRRIDRAIAPGPIALESRLPLQKMLRRLRQRRIPAVLSFHAGTFLCNHVFYLVRRFRPSLPSGFVHVPASTHGRIRGWPLGRIRRAVDSIVETLVGV